MILAFHVVRFFENVPSILVLKWELLAGVCVY